MIKSKIQLFDIELPKPKNVSPPFSHDVFGTEVGLNVFSAGIAIKNNKSGVFLLKLMCICLFVL